MDPQDVESAADVREGWADWSYSERLEALDTLANETLDQYGYDPVDVDSSGEIPENGQYSDGEILVDPGVLEDPNADTAIHVTDHETVHAMNDQDGIDDSSYLDDDDDPDGMTFTEDDLNSYAEHGEVGDIARELDNDGFPREESAGASGGGGGGGGPAGAGAGAGGSEYDAGSDTPKDDDLTVEIDWAQGVWIDQATESGMEVDIYFAPMEGW